MGERVRGFVRILFIIWKIKTFKSKLTAISSLPMTSLYLSLWSSHVVKKKKEGPSYKVSNFLSSSSSLPVVIAKRSRISQSLRTTIWFVTYSQMILFFECIMYNRKRNEADDRPFFFFFLLYWSHGWKNVFPFELSQHYKSHTSGARYEWNGVKRIFAFICRPFKRL